MHEHASPLACRLGLLLWILPSVLSSPCLFVCHSLGNRLLGAIAGGDSHVGPLGSPQCHGALAEFRCRTSQGASTHLGHFGIARYFPNLYEVYILSSLK
jgi:hypothetical protein